ncbi:MAG: helix-turn-helix transcriptional regulator [Rikenellaceae bacterium]|nr:helix-turn-helix transcriptional regulator [Rikenellaceae bacterium]
MQRMKIVIIHPNSLCGLAMRSILADMAPFVHMFREVDVVSYNSMDEFMEDGHQTVVHFFADAQTVRDNITFFTAPHRRCIVLSEGNDDSIEGFHSLDLYRSERELLKTFLMMFNTAHMAHGNMSHTLPQEEELTLSQREKDVLALLVKGYINKEIADRLNISTPTVIFHRRNISEKIGSKSIGRLTIYAVMNGIVDVREL